MQKLGAAIAAVDREWQPGQGIEKLLQRLDRDRGTTSGWKSIFHDRNPHIFN
jgi:hypothetical protein